MSAERKQHFEGLVTEAVKAMKKATKTAVSSAYIVRRDSGEVIVQRSTPGRYETLGQAVTRKTA